MQKGTISLLTSPWSHTGWKHHVIASTLGCVAISFPLFLAACGDDSSSSANEGDETAEDFMFTLDELEELGMSRRNPSTTCVPATTGSTSRPCRRIPTRRSLPPASFRATTRNLAVPQWTTR